MLVTGELSLVLTSRRSSLMLWQVFRMATSTCSMLSLA